MRFTTLRACWFLNNYDKHCAKWTGKYIDQHADILTNGNWLDRLFTISIHARGVLKYISGYFTLR